MDIQTITQTKTLASETNNMEKILQSLEPQMEVTTEDGYTGTLTLDHTTVKVMADGYAMAKQQPLRAVSSSGQRLRFRRRQDQCDGDLQKPLPGYQGEGDLMKEKYITDIGEITNDDWKHYLSFTPIEYIQYIQNGLKYNNRFFVDIALTS